MRSLLTSSVFCFAALASLAGCGQVESSPSEADEGPPPGAATTPPVVAPSPAATRYPGYVSLTSSPDRLDLSASFARRIAATPEPITPGCQRLERQLGPGADEAEPRSESAGKLSFEVAAKENAVSSTLAFDPAAGGYAHGSIDGPVRDGRVDLPGGAIRIRASGGNDATSVPAFDVTVTAAFALRLDEPAAGTKISATSSDLVVRWKDGGNKGLLGFLWIGGEEIRCQLDPAAGQAIIPAALVRSAVEAERSRHPTSGTGSLAAAFSLYALNTTTVAAGDWDVAITRSAIIQTVLQVE